MACVRLRTVFDPCGRASGSYKATAGKGEFTDTKYAKLGDLGSRVLPTYDTGTVWEAGSTMETMASFRAVHGGGCKWQCQHGGRAGGRRRRQQQRSRDYGGSVLTGSLHYITRHRHRNRHLQPPRSTPRAPADQYRLCPLESNLTEACFQQTPMPFVGNSKLMISDGKYSPSTTLAPP